MHNIMLLVITIAASVVSISFANATSLRFNTAGEISGIDDVLVGDSLYDATFLPGAYIDNPSQVHEYNRATTFSYSLARALMVDLQGSAFWDKSAGVVGCTPGVETLCAFSTVYDFTSNSFNVRDISSSIVTSSYVTQTSGRVEYLKLDSVRDYTHIVYTNWALSPAVSAVPIPGAVWFMGTALIGLVGYSRKNKSQIAA